MLYALTWRTAKTSVFYSQGSIKVLCLTYRELITNKSLIVQIWNLAC